MGIMMLTCLSCVISVQESDQLYECQMSYIFRR